MIADYLLKRFDLIADAPGNIPRLRKLIVDLAVRGKLLKKTSGDTSPEELLKRIAAKRELLIKTGKLRKQKPLLPIAAEELPAAYSAHCVFERLGNVAILEKGLTGIQSATRGEYPLVVTAEARSTCDHFDFDGTAAIIPMVSSSGHGDASLKRLHYQQGKFALGNILCAAFPISNDLISARFLYEYLTAFKEELLVSKMIGTANVSLTMGKIGDVPIPIVAPAVQQRVEELMSLCDALETARQEREAVRTRLRTAALHQLASPDSDSSSAAFILQNLPRLSAEPEDLPDIRQSILQLAMKGHLADQVPKRDSSSTGATADRNTPFALPTQWQWVKLGSVAELINGDRSKNYPNKSEYVRSGVPWINTGHIEPDGSLSPELMHHISRAKFDSLRSGKVQRGDLVYCLRGATLGKTAIITQYSEGAVASSLVIIRLASGVEPRFAYRFLTSPLGREQIRSFDNGTAQPNLSANSVKKYWMPLPPLAEQRRIVAKVDELMAVLDALEAALTTARTTAAALLAATIARLSEQTPTATTARREPELFPA